MLIHYRITPWVSHTGRDGWAFDVFGADSTFAVLTLRGIRLAVRYWRARGAVRVGGGAR